MGVSSGLEPDVLVRSRVGEKGDQGERGLLDARPDAADEAVLPDGRVDLPIVQDPLDLMEHLLPLLAVALALLAIEEVLYLRHDARRVGRALHRQDLDAGGRVARGAEAAEDHAVQLALAPGGEE